MEDQLPGYKIYTVAARNFMEPGENVFDEKLFQQEMFTSVVKARHH